MILWKSAQNVAQLTLYMAEKSIQKIEIFMVIFIMPKVNSLQLAKYRPIGMAQWTSHPPQEQEDPGSNPARV
jgi:hypothetical protein